MTYRDLFHTAIGFASVAAIGMGCWWIDPAYGLIAVGSILLSGIFYARTRGAR